MERQAPLLWREQVDSTNTRMKALAREGAVHGTVLAAREQTGGRGRQGRSFLSPPGGLYLSMLLRPACPPERCASLTPLAAVAVRRALGQEAAVIKWPNDVLLHGKKLCGILTELVMDGEKPVVVLGIGVNVNTRAEEFPPELRQIAGSLYTETGQETEISALARRLIRELDRLYAAWCDDAGCCLEEYRAACASVGRPVQILQNGGSRAAYALAVEEDFSLRVRYPDGAEEAIRFGEVSVRG